MPNISRSMSDATRLWSQLTQIGLESQMVIGMRVAGMIGILPSRQDENHRMLSEKMDAAGEAGQAMMKAVSRGASADQVMSAGLGPYGRRTSANAKRLTHAASRNV